MKEAVLLRPKVDTTTSHLDVDELISLQNHRENDADILSNSVLPVFDNIFIRRITEDPDSGDKYIFITKFDRHGNATVMGQRWVAESGEYQEIRKGTYSKEYSFNELKQGKIDLTSHEIVDTASGKAWKTRITDWGTTGVVATRANSSGPDAARVLAQEFEEKEKFAFIYDKNGNIIGGPGIDKPLPLITQTPIEQDAISQIQEDQEMPNLDIEDTSELTDVDLTADLKKLTKDLEEANKKHEDDIKMQEESSIKERESWDKNFDEAIKESESRKITSGSTDSLKEAPAVQPTEPSSSGSSTTSPLKENIEVIAQDVKEKDTQLVEPIIEKIKAKGSVIADLESLKLKLGQIDAISEKGMKGVSLRSELRRILPGFRSHEQKMADRESLQQEVQGENPSILKQDIRSLEDASVPTSITDAQTDSGKTEDKSFDFMAVLTKALGDDREQILKALQEMPEAISETIALRLAKLEADLGEKIGDLEKILKGLNEKLATEKDSASSSKKAESKVHPEIDSSPSKDEITGEPAVSESDLESDAAEVPISTELNQTEEIVSEGYGSSPVQGTLKEAPRVVPAHKITIETEADAPLAKVVSDEREMPAAVTVIDDTEIEYTSDQLTLDTLIERGFVLGAPVNSDWVTKNDLQVRIQSENLNVQKQQVSQNGHLTSQELFKGLGIGGEEEEVDELYLAYKVAPIELFEGGVDLTQDQEIEINPVESTESVGDSEKRSGQSGSKEVKKANKTSLKHLGKKLGSDLESARIRFDSVTDTAAKQDFDLLNSLGVKDANSTQAKVTVLESPVSLETVDSGRFTIEFIMQNIPAELDIFITPQKRTAMKKKYKLNPLDVIPDISRYISPKLKEVNINLTEEKIAEKILKSLRPSN